MIDRPRTGFLLTALLCLLVTPQAFAATDWQSLSPQEQRILAPLQQEWAGLPEARRERFINGAQRWQQMTPEQRAQATLSTLARPVSGTAGKIAGTLSTLSGVATRCP